MDQRQNHQSAEYSLIQDVYSSFIQNIHVFQQILSFLNMAFTGLQLSHFNLIIQKFHSNVKYFVTKDRNPNLED